jgi:hypothetical protein
LLLNLSQGTGLRALPEGLSALNKSIVLVRQRNVRVLHLAGHARKECGFIWNANDEAAASKTFDVEAISLAIGAMAGQQGPMVFVLERIERVCRLSVWCVRGQSRARHCQLANTEQTLAANEAVDAGLEGRLDEHGLGAPPQSSLHAVPTHTSS